MLLLLCSSVFLLLAVVIRLYGNNGAIRANGVTFSHFRRKLREKMLAFREKQRNFAQLFC